MSFQANELCRELADLVAKVTASKVHIVVTPKVPNTEINRGFIVDIKVEN